MHSKSNRSPVSSSGKGTENPGRPTHLSSGWGFKGGRGCYGASKYFVQTVRDHLQGGDQRSEDR